MISGTVVGVDGLQIAVRVNKDTQTKVAIERGHTRIERRDNDEKETPWKEARAADVRNGDHIEVRGANPLKADSIRVTKGTPKDVADAQEFNARKVPPAPGQAPAKPEDGVKVLPAEHVGGAAVETDEEYHRLEYGERRAYREKKAREEAKAGGQEVVKQTKDTDAGNRAAAAKGK